MIIVVQTLLFVKGCGFGFQFGNGCIGWGSGSLLQQRNVFGTDWWFG